jgi:hypothetical protein
MDPRFMCALSAFGLVAGCSFSHPSPPLADVLELTPSPVTIERGTSPPAPPSDVPDDDERPDALGLLPPFIPEDDERPDGPRLFPIKY